MKSNEYRKKIIETSIAMYNKRGCRGVTMDDISTALRISKRTIYEVFSDKEELVLSCLTEVHRKITKQWEVEMRGTDDPVLQTISILKATLRLNEQYAKLILDAESIYPNLNKKVLQMHNERFKGVLTQIFNNAAKQGKLQEGVDVELSAQMLTYTMHRLYNTLITKNTQIRKAITNSIYIYLRGMMTIEAIKQYDWKRLEEETK